MKLLIHTGILAGLLFLFFSCREEGTKTPEGIEFEWNFENDAQGWEGSFADYPVGEEEFYELEFGYEFLPAPLDTTKGALKLSGSNRSDDLFMYAKKKITGLVPKTVYTLSFFVEFASNVPDNQVGIGGSPGESVYVKAGATGYEPERVVDNMNYYRMNTKKGNQSQGGTEMIVIGDFSNDTSLDVYVLKTVTNSEREFSAMTNEFGELWIIVGTDSGFEGTTSIYFNYIRVELFSYL